MNALPTNSIETGGTRRPGQHAGARIFILALVVFFAGAALSALWFYRDAFRAAPIASAPENPAPPPLSDATKEVLRHLDSPVEIHFYSVLDATSVTPSVQAYAVRVDQLLGQYEQAAGGRLKVTRCDAAAASSADAASADGIRAFNIDKGQSCFLGIAVVCGSQKESLSQLAPEWEPALEADLTRAIGRAAEAKAAEHPLPRTDAATLAAVRRSIPNLEAVSLEDGTKILRDAQLAQFKQAVEEMKAQAKDAEQRFIQAQSDQSAAGQQAATEQLRKIQADGTAKLQQIGANSQLQIAALQQLKKTAP